MKNSVLTMRAWVLLIAAAVLVAAGALNFAQRLTHTPPLTDGVDWIETSEGHVVAESIDPNSAAGRKGVFGIVRGDRLVAVGVDDADEGAQIERASDVQIYLEDAKATGQLRYLIERRAGAGEPSYYYVQLDRLTTLQNWTTRDLYVNLVGIVYLLVGLFVLFKQGERAPFVLHFALLCLAAFVFHFYKPFGSIEDLDSIIYFLDEAALALFAPLFLHFCLVYPVRQRLSAKRPWLVYLLYAPAAVIVLLDALFLLPQVSQKFMGLARLFPHDFSAKLWLAEFACLTVALVLGASILVYRFAKSESAVVRQQLKWVVWGSAVAVAPFTLLYAAGYLFGGGLTDLLSESAARRVTDAAILPLVLIPLTFGNSVVRYRLMDVDMVVRRTAVYALTTLAVALGIGAVIYVVVLKASGLDLVALRGEGRGPGVATLQFVVATATMALIVMMAGPLKNFLQEKIDRFFYGERYDLRTGLLDFGRTLSATTALEPLLNALVSRLQQVLGVERIAIFIEDARAASDTAWRARPACRATRSSSRLTSAT
jgi:Ca2+/Na+ antiporter